MTAPDLDALQALLKQPFRNGMPINELCADALNAITELKAEVTRLNAEALDRASRLCLEEGMRTHAEAEVAHVKKEFRKVEILWKQAQIDLHYYRVITKPGVN
jgi:hypothetical protein